MVGALAALYGVVARRHDHGPGRPLPNALTAVRGAAAAILFGMYAADAYPSLWVLAAAAAAVEASDWLDGRIARRGGNSAFGAVWDMENDAAFTLALALVVYSATSAPWVVLLVGAMRYLYVLMWRYVVEPTVVPRAYKVYAKVTAATIVVTLIVVLMPIVDERLRAAAIGTVLAMQGVSFAWDLLLQRRELRARRGRGGPRTGRARRERDATGEKRDSRSASRQVSS